MSDNYRFRAAPSPTGRVHTGNLRTFLNNFLAAKHYKGKSVLRIEDTDQDRKVEGGAEAIVETLKLYGIEFDEGPSQGGDFGPYIQSERIDLYNKHAKELVEKDAAYYCFCSSDRLTQMREEQIARKEAPRYDRTCRRLSKEESQKRVDNGEAHVVRMKFPIDGETTFRDEIYGTITVQNKEIDDMVLLKSDGFPTYHFGVVVDDHHMGITHVFRGREYLTQTSRNVFLYESFGWKQPKWIHTPHLLNPDGKGKLSKRHGAMPALSYLRLGYLPEAVLNYLILCGWAPKQALAHKDEVYTMAEMEELYTIDRMKKSNARYDEKKLTHLNGEHIRRLSLDDLTTRVIEWAQKYVLGEFIADQFDEHKEWEDKLKSKVRKYLPLWKADLEKFKGALTLEHKRITKLSELPDSLDFFYEKDLTWVDEDWNTKNRTKSELADGLEGVLPQLDKIFKGGDFDHDKWETVVRGYADELNWKHGTLFMAIRSATTGRLQSPPLLESFEVMGWNKAKSFIEQAVVWLRN